jgi:hypothetical protein
MIKMQEEKMAKINSNQVFNNAIHNERYKSSDNNIINSQVYNVNNQACNDFTNVIRPQTTNNKASSN